LWAFLFFYASFNIVTTSAVQLAGVLLVFSLLIVSTAAASTTERTAATCA